MLTDVVEQEAVGRLATARLRSPSGGIVDLVFAACGVEAAIVAASQHIEILPGVVVPVARPGHLVAMKVLSVDADRPRDAQDLKDLVAMLDEAERERAAAAVAGMMRAGTHRQRDLPSLLARWLAGESPTV